jgi:alkylation response protein AidB-like acyl-CoA dehydrogenase/acyl carrier protein
LEQLGGMDLSASILVGLNNYLGVWPILRHATPKLQHELLPQVASGQRLVGFAIAEPGVEGGPATWSSHAEPVNGSGWRLRGRKFLSGGMPGSDVLNTFVGSDLGSGVSAFVIRNGANATVPLERLSEQGVYRDTVNLEGLFVENDRLLGRAGEGMAIAREAIRYSHLAIGAACLGGIKRCSQLIFRHATQRNPAAPGLVAHPVTMTKLGRITAEVTALECLVRQLADATDAQRPVSAQAFAVCKLVAPEMLWQAVDDLVQLLGRRGIVETLQVRRLVDDARVLRALEGPIDAGAALLGAGLLSGAAEPLDSAITDLVGVPGLESLVEEVVAALHLSRRAIPDTAPPPQVHWRQARAGELATWIVLLGAVELRLRAGSTPDLDRTATWVRSNVERVLSRVRSGPPPEVNLGAVGQAIATYESAVGGLPIETERHPRVSASGFHRRRQRDVELRAWVISWLAARLRVSESQIASHRSFADHGMDSLAAVEFAKALADRLGRQLDETLLWNFSTIDALLSHLSSDSETTNAVAAGHLPPAEHRAENGGDDVQEELARLESELARRS